MSFRYLRAWFWFLSLSGSLIVGMTGLWTLVDRYGGYNLEVLAVVVYPLVGILMLGTLGVAGVLVSIARRAL